MLKRTITGAFITFAVYLTLYFSNNPTVMLCATAILCTFSVYEIYRATDTIGNEAFFTLSMLAAAGISFWEIPHYTEVLGITFAASVLYFIWLMVRQKHCRLSSSVKAAFIVLIIVLLFKAMPELREIENGLHYLTLAITLCFVTDVAAYLVGKSLGRHKLSPKVSPNKTIEGAAAGTVFAVFVILLCGAILEHFELAAVNYPLLATYALLASLIGQFGDLAMSAVKRVCAIKDFGNVFPGHGGILDRFDSHMFCVAFTLLFCSVTGGFLI